MVYRLHRGVVNLSGNTDDVETSTDCKSAAKALTVIAQWLFYLGTRSYVISWRHSNDDEYTYLVLESIDQWN